MALGATLVPVGLAGQTCTPGPSSNEASVLAVRSLSLAMSRGAALATDAPGTIRGGVEGIWFPPISDAEAQPTVCRPGKGPENVNPLAAAARVRIGMTLPGRVQLEASWLPPVTVSGVRGNVGGIALSYWRVLSPAVAASLRVHAARGSVTGPFTCSSEAVREPLSECFGGTVSSDRLEPAVLGADVAMNWARAASRFSWYGGAGFSRLSPRFRVHFRNGAGVLDSTRVVVDLDRVTMFAGVTRAVSARWRASAEVYASPSDGATARILIDGVVRRGR
jgi:hypothetical protein